MSCGLFMFLWWIFILVSDDDEGYPSRVYQEIVIFVLLKEDFVMLECFCGSYMRIIGVGFI